VSRYAGTAAPAAGTSVLTADTCMGAVRCAPGVTPKAEGFPQSASAATTRPTARRSTVATQSYLIPVVRIIGIRNSAKYRAIATFRAERYARCMVRLGGGKRRRGDPHQNLPEEVS
jgi:hypothetical protein